MSLSILPRHLLDASHGIRSSIATSDLQQSLNSYRVGQISGWTSLLEFTTAVNRFPCAVSAELGMIANAMALGVDNAQRADRIVEVDTPDVEWMA